MPDVSTIASLSYDGAGNVAAPDPCVLVGDRDELIAGAAAQLAIILPDLSEADALAKATADVDALQAPVVAPVEEQVQPAAGVVADTGDSSPQTVAAPAAPSPEPVADAPAAS